MRLIFDTAGFARAVAGKLKVTGLDVRTCADLTGVSASTVSRCSRGRPPDVQTLAALLGWLELPFEAFLVEAESNG